MVKTSLRDELAPGKPRVHTFGLCLAGFISGALMYGCGDEPPADDEPPATGSVSFEVSYKNDLDETATDSLHVWVLQPKEGERLNCSDLVAGESDPYDGGVARLADVVLTDLDGELEVESIVGKGFLYVEGVDFSGEAHIAGCSEINVKEGGASGSVSLVAAGVFDCSDSDTKDGAPCDDGSFCTVGEACSGGSCSGGRARDCSGGAGACSAGTCSEEEGCVFTPQPDDTPCDDELNCTTNDACQSGECVGAAVDCSSGADVCESAGYCEESTGECVYSTVTTGTACDDGLYCTTSSACLSGSCNYLVTNRLCPTSDCVLTASCNETAEDCDQTFTAADTACDDNPCIDFTGGDGVCDGSGNCTAGENTTYRAEGTSCQIDCQTGSCDDTGTCVLSGDAADLTTCDGGLGTCQDGVCTD